MWNKIAGDNFLLGLFVGIISLVLSYLLLRYMRLMMVQHYGNPYFFPSPRVELICILINILLFRFSVVNCKKEKMGKGILFSTVIISLTYFFLFYRFNFRLP